MDRLLKPMTWYPSWISECLEMFGIANNVQDFLNNSMKSWKLELNASGEILGEVDIRRGIFQGDSLFVYFVYSSIDMVVEQS